MPLALAALLAWPAGLHQAGMTAVGSDGRVYTVVVESDPDDPSLQGLVLSESGSSGTSVESILSTFDALTDLGPQIALNPLDGQPILVWSRHDGSDFELAILSRHSAGGWSPIGLLTSNGTQDQEARILADDGEIVHVLWWPSGVGGPNSLQSFDVRNGQPVTAPQRPLEPPVRSPRLRTTVVGGSDVGGGDDPGTSGLQGRAAATGCLANPAAAPDHGVLKACGRPAAYQLSACQLIVGTVNPYTGAWEQTIADLSTASLSGTSVREVAQSVADARCR